MKVFDELLDAILMKTRGVFEVQVQILEDM